MNMQNDERLSDPNGAAPLDATVRHWTQRGFCVVSKVIVEDGYLPVLHGFYPAEWEAKAALEKLDELPADLRVDAAVVKAELRYGA